MNPADRDPLTLALEFAARVLFAIVTFVYFIQMPVAFWTLDLSLTVAMLVGYLMLQSAVFGRALFGQPAWWLPVLAGLIDAAAILAALVSDPFDLPPSLVLALIAALNLGVRLGWTGFLAGLGGAALLVATAVALRGAVTTEVAHGLTGLLLPAALGLLYFTLLAFRRNSLAEQAARFVDQDVETQLLNRRGFDNAASYLLPLQQRTQLPLVIMLASLDSRSSQQPLAAKPRAAAVRQLGHVVRLRARRSDVVARLSADEFVFMLFDTPPAGGEKLARALLEHFDGWAAGQHPEARLTFAMISAPEEPVAVDQLIARARSSAQRAQKHPSSPSVVTAPSL